MALHFFSRRTYQPGRDVFTDNPAALTRHVVLPAPSTHVPQDAILPVDSWVDQVVAEAAGQGIVCLVHGFNVSQLDGQKMVADLQKGLAAHGFGGKVIGFDWPTQPGQLAYRKDKKNGSNMAAFMYSEGLKLLMTHPQRPKVHLMAHSMGCHVTLEGFGRSGDAGGVAWSIGEALFVAADVDNDIMQRGGSGALVMKKRSKRLTNYYSNLDSVLGLAILPFNGGNLRLGRTGIPTPAEAEHADVFCGARYRSQFPADQSNARLSHNWYFSDPTFLKDAARTIGGASKSSLEGVTRAPGAGGHPDQALIP